VEDTSTEFLGPSVDRISATGGCYDLLFLYAGADPAVTLRMAASWRSNPLLSRTQFVLLSTRLAKLRREEMRDAGIRFHLLRPVREDHLLTTIRAALDLEPVAAASPDAPAAHRPATQFPVFARPLRILIAEDNAVNQRLVRRVLEKLGHSADIAVNGSQAIDAAGRTDYDLILMDCQMPEVDGYEATRHIREQQGSTRHTPIIAMTANVLVGDRERCLECGMDDYLPKPIDIRTLALAVERWSAVSRTGPESVDADSVESI
jgi:CheY-like chemotaxis protein